MKFKGVLKKGKNFVNKHAPQILTGVGIASGIAAGVMAVKATPKALQLIDEAEYVKGERLTPVETVQATWKEYAPAVTTGVFSVICIVGGAYESNKRNIVLAAAYKVAEETVLDLREFKDGAKEYLTEDQQRDIQSKVTAKRAERNPEVTEQNKLVIHTNTSDDWLCIDTISGQEFYSTYNKLREIQNDLNERLNNRDYMSLTDLYYMLGIRQTDFSDRMGWNIDRGCVKFEFDPTIMEDGRIAVELCYNILPRDEFDMYG